MKCSLHDLNLSTVNLRKWQLMKTIFSQILKTVWPPVDYLSHNFCLNIMRSSDLDL